jgi:lipopolysaccharide transport system ATP-binding protein
MTVRLAFAVQAMVDPDILIVDEALAVGDEMFQRKCFRRLNELKRTGTSILFVSHSAQQIIELCDRALLLEQGQRLMFADPLTVVRAYQKMIFANPIDQARMIQEFKELDQDGGIKQNVSPVIPPEEYTPAFSELGEKVSETDFFESGLVPQTTEFHPIQGARIDSIKIYNSAGREVNSLLAGREYKFEICGKFLLDLESVNIKVLIRTKTGLPITGLLYPSNNKYITEIKSNQKFRLVQKLSMGLLPETYFVSMSIWSTSEQTPLHRVVDMIMFRVLPKAENRVFGYVDLTEGEPVFEIVEE